MKAMTSMPITGGQQLVKPSSKRKKLFYLSYIVKTHLDLYFSKISYEINYWILHWGILPTCWALLLRSVFWDYPVLVIMSSILLPLFHTLPTPSTKIPMLLPSPQLSLPSLPEGMSFFLALTTHSYSCLYFSRVSTNYQFCLMSLLCHKAAKSTHTSPIFAEDETKQLGYSRSCARTTN